METRDLGKRYCRYCEQPLKVIGRDRRNGKDNYFDWHDREIHKKCLKEETKRFLSLYKRRKDNNNSEEEEN